MGVEWPPPSPMTSWSVPSEMSVMRNLKGLRKVQHLGHRGRLLHADTTCARLMGLLPELVPHIAEAAKFLGNVLPGRIDQLAADVVSPAAPFQTVEEFEHLREKAGPQPATLP